MIIIFGGLSAAFALVIELVLVSLFPASANALSPTLPMLLFATFAEETSKFIFLRRYAVFFLKNTSLPLKKSAWLGCLFGVGFSLPELWFAFSNTHISNLLPLTGIIIVHTATSLLFAYALFAPLRGRALFLVFCMALLLHSAYNAALLLSVTIY